VNVLFLQLYLHTRTHARTHTGRHSYAGGARARSAQTATRRLAGLKRAESSSPRGGPLAAVDRRPLAWENVMPSLSRTHTHTHTHTRVRRHLHFALCNFSTAHHPAVFKNACKRVLPTPTLSSGFQKRLQKSSSYAYIIQRFSKTPAKEFFLRLHHQAHIHKTRATSHAQRQRWRKAYSPNRQGHRHHVRLGHGH